jgi:hypothetical protein
MINYDNRTFRSVQTTLDSEVTEETTFIYQQEGYVVSAVYNGGPILFGQLIATVNESGELDMRYHHLNMYGELKTGICHAIPEILPNGKIRLHEKWRWTSEEGEGESVVEEV